MPQRTNDEAPSISAPLPPIRGGLVPYQLPEPTLAPQIAYSSIGPNQDLNLARLKKYVEAIQDHPRPWRWIVVGSDWNRFQDDLSKMVHKPVEKGKQAYTLPEQRTTYISAEPFKAPLEVHWQRLIDHETGHGLGANSESDAEKRGAQLKKGFAKLQRQRRR